ncbi:hypothetical protein P171DRAFT_445590 [Karstenula rhodostoma CBS 690.94]|uniref:Uncharacterized protein n=1 Tax=Karstenula rhodostoma CBS 690.94 TaxID=1392251 RepID=A0A9P4PFB2_9PLEO|nr:hypothetical protein P171DRAFT_445590 [Karstenula rhodostoma CBS 690.94]
MYLERSKPTFSLPEIYDRKTPPATSPAMIRLSTATVLIALITFATAAEAYALRCKCDTRAGHSGGTRFRPVEVDTRGLDRFSGVQPRGLWWKVVVDSVKSRGLLAQLFVFAVRYVFREMNAVLARFHSPLGCIFSNGVNRAAVLQVNEPKGFVQGSVGHVPLAYMEPNNGNRFADGEFTDAEWTARWSVRRSKRFASVAQTLIATHMLVLPTYNMISDISVWSVMRPREQPSNDHRGGYGGFSLEQQPTMYNSGVVSHAHNLVRNRRQSQLDR